jgi:DNA-binding transcriptional ArsR family regulator
MVNSRQPVLDKTFAALADPTRRAILVRLQRGETTVGELAAPFRMSLPAVSKHLTVLERAGLIERRREGRMQHCRLRARPMSEAEEWLERFRRFWEGSLDALEAYLEEEEKQEKRRKK